MPINQFCVNSLLGWYWPSLGTLLALCCQGFRSETPTLHALQILSHTLIQEVGILLTSLAILHATQCVTQHWQASSQSEFDESWHVLTSALQHAEGTLRYAALCGIEEAAPTINRTLATYEFRLQLLKDLADTVIEDDMHANRVLATFLLGLVTHQSTHDPAFDELLPWSYTVMKKSYTTIMAGSVTPDKMQKIIF